jgi:photosystem II stability/assembly factor-like uncharacterized protein
VRRGVPILLVALLFGRAAPSGTQSTGRDPAPRWTTFSTGVTARLRGISAVSDRVVWASGSDGTVVRTGDGGRSWQVLSIPGSETLDFRDIDAVNARTAFLLSIGPGDASRIYKTTDAGARWTLQFRNDDPKAFYDAMAFRDDRGGFALSDSVDGRLVLLRTGDGGAHWTLIADGLPPALAGEGAYAASGTSVAIHQRSIWLGTSASRVIRSDDDGRTWTASVTPLPSSASAGIFSIAFRDALHGLVVGGDYRQERAAIDNAAITTDGGASWSIVRGLGGFRSAVAFVPARGNIAVAVGPSGSDLSTDGGRRWHAIEGPGFHTLSVAPRGGGVWAAGEQGQAGRLEFR